jgi:hypothetical protein
VPASGGRRGQRGPRAGRWGRDSGPGFHGPDSSDVSAGGPGGFADGPAGAACQSVHQRPTCPARNQQPATGRGCERRPCPSSPSPRRWRVFCEGSTRPPWPRADRGDRRWPRCSSSPRAPPDPSGSAFPPGPDVLRLDADPSFVAADPLLHHRYLREGPVDVHPDVSHLSAPLDVVVDKELPGGTTHGFALAAQPGQSLGRPSTNASSQLKV